MVTNILVQVVLKGYKEHETSQERSEKIVQSSKRNIVLVERLYKRVMTRKLSYLKLAIHLLIGHGRTRREVSFKRL